MSKSRRPTSGNRPKSPNKPYQHTNPHLNTNSGSRSNQHIKEFLKPNKNARTRQGYLEEHYQPSKYIGKRPIIYRSSYELDAFMWADKSPQVISWTTEPFPIEYTDFKTGKNHKYWIDMVIKFLDGSTGLIEIKPKSQVPKDMEQVRSNEIMRKNWMKWEACKEFCKRNYGFKFVLITEDALFSMTGLEKYSRHIR